MIRMRRIASSSIARLIAGYVLVATVFTAAWLWSLSGPLTEATLRQQERNLTSVAQSASLVVMQSDQRPDQIVQQMVARTDLRLTIVAADGTVIADSDIDPQLMENHADRPEIRAALSGATGVARRLSESEGEEQLYAAVPGTLEDKRIAVRVSQSLDAIGEITARSRRVGLLLLVGALALTLAIAVPAARSVARPVRHLSESAERMAQGNLSVRIPDVPPDLAVLADALSSLREQMRARLEALDAEKRSLRAALDGLADAVLVFDGDVVRLANRSADRMFRAPASGWRGADLESTPLPASLKAAIRERLESADFSAIELDPDPTGKALRLVVAPLDAGTPGGRTIAVVSDVTERSRLERMRRDFVANASHELKTPVAGIRLLAESAETAAADGDAEMAMTFARQIASEIARLQHLVGDLLDLSRLETVPAPDATADIRSAVENAVVSHHSAAARKGLALDADFSAVRDTDVFALADPTDVAIALDNLIDNAIAYAERGSVRVVVGVGAESVDIAVIDTGAGIPAEHLPRVFERFYRVDRGRSRESGGTGLGLALVRHVVERSGGSVSVESEPGKGSTFSLRLRRAL